MNTIELVGVIFQQAQTGIVFTSRHGAICPGCNKKVKIYCTRPWDGGVRVRYHKCTNGQCVVGHAGISIKSVEEE